MVRVVLYCTFPLKVEYMYLYLWEMTVLFSKDREPPAAFYSSSGSKNSAGGEGFVAGIAAESSVKTTVVVGDTGTVRLKLLLK